MLKDLSSFLLLTILPLTRISQYFLLQLAYNTLGNLVAPQKPVDESYTRLVELMSSYYNLVTVQRYKFYIATLMKVFLHS